LKEELRELILYRLERAFESLAESRLLFNEGHFNTYVNRLYYACFYAVSALLLMKGLSSSKHSGTRSLFHQNFIKTGILPLENGQLYDKLFDNRQKADYADMITFNADEVNDWYNDVKLFLDSMKALIQNELI